MNGNIYLFKQRFTQFTDFLHQFIILHEWRHTVCFPERKYSITSSARPPKSNVLPQKVIFQGVCHCTKVCDFQTVRVGNHLRIQDGCSEALKVLKQNVLSDPCTGQNKDTQNFHISPQTNFPKIL